MFSQLFRSLSIFAVAFRLLIDYLWMDFLNRFRSDEAVRAAEGRAYRRWGRLIRNTALRLHGLIIKVGQFLSARADMLPEDFTRELAALQDAVPPADFPAVRARVESELGAPIAAIFQEFDEVALASASLGQVHRAVLKEGPTVAVKVLRPGIEQTVVTDLAALRRIITFLHRHTRLGQRFDLPAVADEFEHVTYEEMDYRKEAENIRKFRKHFANVPGVDLPYPFDNLVSEKLLVMEFETGMKVTEHDRLTAAGVDLAELAERLVNAYLKQILIDGFVHVDPHPGNLMIRPDGTLVFIDFGMMGTITPADREGFSDLIQALLTRNLDGAVKALADLGFLRPSVNTDPLKKALAYLLDRLTGATFNAGPELDRLVVEFREWLHDEPLQFPVRYIYIGRSIGLLVGLCNTLNPAMDWVKVLKERALPMLDQGAAKEGEDGKKAGGFNWRGLVTDIFGPGSAATVDAVLKQAGSMGMSLVRLPGQLERSLGKLESGQVQVQTDLDALTSRLEQQSRATTRLGWAILAAGAAVAGAILTTGGYTRQAHIAYGGGAVALLFLLVSLMSSRRGRRRFGPHRRR